MQKGTLHCKVKLGSQLCIGDDIVITFKQAAGAVAWCIAVTAPKDVKIQRKKLSQEEYHAFFEREK